MTTSAQEPQHRGQVDEEAKEDEDEDEDEEEEDDGGGRDKGSEGQTSSKKSWRDRI